MNIDLIVDKLVFKDVQLTATNDDQYFVFEDILYQVRTDISIYYQNVMQMLSHTFLQNRYLFLDHVMFLKGYRNQQFNPK